MPMASLAALPRISSVYLALSIRPLCCIYKQLIWLSSMSIDYFGHIDAPGQPLPLYAFTVPAGFPSPAQDHIEREILLDELLGLRLPQVFLARVGGDSMRAVGIFDGDLVVVDRAIEAKPGLIVIAALNNGPLSRRFAKMGSSSSFAPKTLPSRPDMFLKAMSCLSGEWFSTASAVTPMQEPKPCFALSTLLGTWPKPIPGLYVSGSVYWSRKPLESFKVFPALKWTR